MSEPSSWPLNKGGVRVLVPRGVLADLKEHPLSRDCFPTALGFYPHARQHQMRRREHDDFLLMYCVDGSGEVQGCSAAGVQFEADIAPGDLVLLPPGFAHHYAARTATPWSLFWCHFTGRQAEAFYTHIGFDKEPVLRGLNDPNLHSGFSSLLNVVGSAYSMTVFIHAANQLRQVLTLIERLRRRSERVTETSILAEVRSYMRNNLHRKLSLEDLARVSQLSKFHFNRRYRALTGYAPLQHFTHLKMEQACYLLESSKMSIAEIGFELGYEDPLYFSRVFRKVTGRAPSEYREGLA